MTTKAIMQGVTVDLDNSREVWNNGVPGDHRISLWADKGNEHVWLETNGDPIAGEVELRESLVALGFGVESIDRIVVGDLSDFDD